MFKKDIFNRPLFLKKLLIRIIGFFYFLQFQKKYKLNIQGAEQFNLIPNKNVLIISNHQTYFADVSFMLLVIQSAISGFPNELKKRGFWKQPMRNIYFISATETMKSGILPRLMALVGGILIKRTWREKGKDIQRTVDLTDSNNISRALKDGWVITFPQGTTKPFTPIRKGTAHIIKENNCVVLPIVIDGFRRAFDKKGIITKKKNVTLKMVIKDPIYNLSEKSLDEILLDIEGLIEQKKK